jgi:formate dehydrogenase iron-sulfur subunit
MYGILVDVTKCTACEKCVAACTKRNDLDPWQADRDRATTPDGLSQHRLSTVLKVGDGRFARKSCMHCLEPSCASACLVGALKKTPEGPVVYNRAMCIGCRYCMLACPFHVPRYQWDKAAPFMVKCDMCADRLSRNQAPACVEACPERALQFGDRSRLLKKAHALIGEHPERYRNHVWGETEFGGCSVMYISDVDLAALGWPAREEAAIPSLTEPLVHKTPFIGLGVAASLLGLNWIVKRRNALAASQEPGLYPGEDSHD